ATAAVEQPIELTASGRITPQTDITGTLFVAPLDETLELRVAPLPATGELAAAVDWQGLDLAYVFAERHFTLSGAASLGSELGPYLPAELAGLEATIEDA